MNKQKNKQGCNNCQQRYINLSKLGRCRACIAQAITFSLLSVALYIWQYNSSGSTSVYSIAALFAVIAFTGLSLLHLLAMAWYKIKA